MKLIKRMAVSFHEHRLVPFVVEGPIAELLAKSITPSMARDPRVTWHRRGWRYELRVWFASVGGLWFSPALARMSAPEFAITRLRSWWRRSPLPRAKVVQR